MRSYLASRVFWGPFTGNFRAAEYGVIENHPALDQAGPRRCGICLPLKLSFGRNSKFFESKRSGVVRELEQLSEVPTGTSFTKLRSMEEKDAASG